MTKKIEYAKKREYPRYIKVYFKDAQAPLVDAIEAMAKEYNIPVSQCANMILAAGTATVKSDLEKMGYLKLKKTDVY